MGLTFGRVVATNNGEFSLTLVGDGLDSLATIDLSVPPFSLVLGTGIVPVDVVVTSFGSRGGSMQLNPANKMQVNILVAPNVTGPIIAGQLVDVSGFLTFAAPMATPLPAPTGLVAVAGTHQVSLSWAASLPGVTGYRVLRATVTTGPYSQIALTTSPNYLDTQVISGTPYYYVVEAVDLTGPSVNSAEATATPT